jgi:hypothetical protein
MATPNSAVSEIVSATIESRSKKFADNVTKNNAALAYLEKAGNVKTITGGSQILQEVEFAENANGAWYSGFDSLSLGSSEVFTAATFAIKQLACPVVMSGLEMLQNSGKEQFIDLASSRITNAEHTLRNLVSQGVYADGTGSGGKEITGLGLAVPITPTSGTYGGIDRSVATNAFWRSTASGTLTAVTSSNVLGYLNTYSAAVSRGQDKPNLVLMDNTWWGAFVAACQAQIRFMDPAKANMGFPTLEYMGMPIVLDGGVGGFITTKTALMLNTDFIFWRPHAKRNFVPLFGGGRFRPADQDAEVQTLAWAGNMTSNGPRFSARLISA